MILRSNRDYDARGRHMLTDNKEILDIERDGVVVDSISVQQLKANIKAMHNAGMKSPYGNLFGVSYITNDNFGKKDVLFTISIDTNANVVKSTDDYVTVEHFPAKDGETIALKFDNGFVIGVSNFKTTNYDDEFDTVSFRLFGENETFSRGEEFALFFHITEYNKSRIAGNVNIFQRGHDDGRYVGGQVSIGAFELRKDSSAYRGVDSEVVYDEVHFTKELMLGA